MADTTKFGVAGMGIDTRGIAPLITALRKASPTVARGLREETRAVGEIVAQRARQISSQHSTSIPGTIRTRVYRASVSVDAGRGGVPLAVLYELGNKDRYHGGQGDSETFWHYAWGRKTKRYEQQRYPFLKPALEQTYPEIERGIEAIADKAVQVIAGGF